MDRMKS